MRSCIVSLVAALAFTLVGCGEETPDDKTPTEETPTACEAACAHGKACGDSKEETAECLSTCGLPHVPDTFFQCVTGLSCEEYLDEEVAMERCGDFLIGPHCTQACANMEACDPSPWSEEDKQDCAMGCGIVFPTETQRCLAEAEECPEVAACYGW